MKNSLKKMHYGALVFVFALGLVFTQSAFTTRKVIPNYYLDSSGNWQELSMLTEGTGPNTYECNDQVSRVCTAYFDPSENPDPQPTDSPQPGDINKNGEFILH